MSAARPFASNIAYVILGRVGGVIIPFLVAYLYGAGYHTDAFFMAHAFVLAFSSFVAPVFNAVLLPQLSEFDDQPRKIFQLSNSTVIACLPLIVGVALLVGFSLEPALTRWSGLEPKAASLTGRLFFQMMPFLIFSVLIVAANSVFYVKKTFWFPSISPIIRAFFVIGMMFAFYRAWGVYALSFGYAVGETVRWGVGIILMTTLGLWKIDFDFKAVKDKTKTFLKDAGIQLPAYVALNLILVIDQWFASLVGETSISLMNYAEKLYHIPYIIFMSGVVPIFFTDWSKKYHEISRQELMQQMMSDIRKSLMITAGIAAGLFIIKAPLISILYGRGNLSGSQLEIITELFGWFALVLIPAAWHFLYIRVLYLMKKSTIFTLQALLKLVMNVVLNAVLVQVYGLKGIVIATFLVYLITAVWLHVYIMRTLKGEKV